MMHICLILPYFGKLPNYFPLFLRSCGANPDIQWLLLTDDRHTYDYPPNVAVRYRTFEQFHAKLQKKFDFPIALRAPYKLCDYKPAYGWVLEEELCGFDYWGYCDLDLIFGDMMHFLEPLLGQGYDMIGSMGHFAIYRNTPEINTLFRREIDGTVRYRDVFSTDRICVFDEWEKPSIHDLFRAAGKRMCCDIMWADIYPYHSDFRMVYPDPDSQNRHVDRKSCVAQWKDGRLFVRRETGGQEQERMYLHLQKRSMELEPACLSASEFWIYPDRFSTTFTRWDNLRSRVGKRMADGRYLRHQYAVWRYALIEASGPLRHAVRDRWKHRKEGNH